MKKDSVDQISKDIDKLIAKHWYEGVEEGISMYSWWKDGVQYVGTTGRTLKEALKELEIEYQNKITKIDNR